MSNATEIVPTPILMKKGEIRKLALRIKQVKRFGHKGLCYLKKPMPLFKAHGLYDPRPGDKATNLKRFGYILVCHKGLDDLFLPSSGEIISKIPTEDLVRVVAFEILYLCRDVKYFENYAKGIKTYSVALYAWK